MDSACSGGKSCHWLPHVMGSGCNHASFECAGGDCGIHNGEYMFPFELSIAHDLGLRLSDSYPEGMFRPTGNFSQRLGTMTEYLEKNANSELEMRFILGAFRPTYNRKRQLASYSRQF